MKATKKTKSAKVPSKPKKAGPSARTKKFIRRVDLNSDVPKPHKNAEIITRQGFLIDATGKGPHAVPEVVMLANVEGLRYLAALFTYLAEQAKDRTQNEGNAIVGLPRNEHPLNMRLSDDLDFRFALLTEENRRSMFKRFGIDMASKQKGSLFERYQEVVAHFGRLQNLMRREGLVAEAGGR